MDAQDRPDPMAVVFPKVSKCTFHKYGPSGTIERHDGLCVLPLNIINEKIYIFLWFWFILIASITGLFLLYRLAVLMGAGIRTAMIQVSSQYCNLSNAWNFRGVLVSLNVFSSFARIRFSIKNKQPTNNFVIYEVCRRDARVWRIDNYISSIAKSQCTLDCLQKLSKQSTWLDTC